MADIPEGPPLAPGTWPPVRRSGSEGVLALATMGLLFALFVFVATPIQLYVNMGFGLWFTELFVFLGVTWVLLRVSGRDPLAYPRMAWPGARPVLLGFVVGVVNFVAVAGPIQAICQSLAPPGLRELFDQSHLFEDQTPLELAVLVAGVSLAAPVCEEYFFRGVLQRGLLSWLPPVAAIPLAGFIFSGFHLDPIGLAGRWELGILFGCLFYWTGSLWPGVMAHAANNIVSLGLFFLTPEADPTAADAPPSARAIAFMFFLGAPILLLLLRAVARSAPPPPEREPAWRPIPFFRAALPWCLATVASLALLVSLDRRGVILNFYDVQVQLPKGKRAAAPWEKEERARLMELRKAARAGKVPIDDYVERRRALARQSGGRERPAVPTPKPVPVPAPHSKR